MPDSLVYNIVFLNDDKTPMDFVVYVLQHFFDLDFDEANKRMLRIHHEGKRSAEAASARKPKEG